MLRRIAKLIHEPAFRRAPLTVIGRGIAWTANVALGRSPAFELVPGVLLKVPSDLRYTSVSAFLLRDAIEPELNYLQDFIGPGSIFIDVGANIGMFTLKAAPRAARVVSVEPGEIACRELKENVELNGFRNVTLVQKALSDRPGKAKLYHNPLGNDPQAFSLLDDGSSPGSEEVELTTLDMLVETLELPRVDCIKIDVEGAEALVIVGARKTITQNLPTVIFEMNCPTLVNSGGDTAAAWNELAEFGYEFFMLEDDGRLTPLARRPTAFTNVVARPRSH